MSLGLALTACASEPPDEWHYMYATIIAPQCTTSACHASLSNAGNVDLHDDAAAYRTLTGRACDDTAAPIGGYVDPANPRGSLLVNLLRRTDPGGMPPTGRLAAAEIALIETWIAGGALCE
ncbi:MAG: hypothetical protein AB7P03_14475 [Kofleriaceae bacterium]